MLHPDILGNAADDNERIAIEKFLTGNCGVQTLDKDRLEGGNTPKHFDKR